MVSRMRHITYIVREHQLRHYGHVARFPEGDPAHKILIIGDPSGWTRPRVRPHNTWLRQIEGNFRKVGLDPLVCLGAFGRCEIRELKDNLGSDDPEGDIPALLQTVLSRNPNVFREKSMQNRYGVQGGIMQQPMMPQYKMAQNSMHNSPASSNYQQTTISHSPSSRFVPPQTSSSNRFMHQQNSPVPSPYAPTSPAGFMQYAHTPSYTQHQQIQQVCVASSMVPGSMRNIHDNKVCGQMSSNSANHHADNSRHGSNEDYLHLVHRLGNEDNDPAIRNASFSLRSPQSVCSPAGSDGAPKAGSRPPLILQSPPPPYASPRDAASDILIDSPDRKKKQKKMKMSKEEKEQADKAAMYDIISSPSKDSTKLTLRLSRVKSSEMDPQGDLLPGMDNSTDPEGDLAYNNMQYTGPPPKTPVAPQDVLRPFNAAAQCLPQNEQVNFLQAQQVPVLQQNNSVVSAKQPQPLAVQPQDAPQLQGAMQPLSVTPYDEVEMDALAEIERIERESAIERERCSKEVQDKDKPLKKRKQDSYPQEPGAGGTAGSTGGTSGGGVGSTGNKVGPQEASVAGNGSSRPALMVSIDLHQAGRTDSQSLPEQMSAMDKQTEEQQGLPTPIEASDGDVPETIKQEDPASAVTPVLENQPEDSSKKSDSETHNVCDERPEVIKHRPETPKQKVENRTEATRQKGENRPETPKPKGDNKPDTVKQKSVESKPETPKQKETILDTPKQKCSENRSDTQHHKSENRRESSSKSSNSEKRSEVSKHRHEGKTDSSKVKTEGRSSETRQRTDGRPISSSSESSRRDHDGHRQDKGLGDQSRMRRPETPKSSSRGEPESKHGVKSESSRDRERERKHRHESGETRERRTSEDQKSRPESPRVKQESKGDSSNRHRPDRHGIRSPNSKDERRSDGNRNRPDSHKSQPDNKAEFPSYLLGGRSGVLKNFVIPKIKRDKDGNITQEIKRSNLKQEHKGKVEKMGLVEDLNKGAKPVVVLQKLTFDEVQKFIKEKQDRNARTSNKSSKNRPSSKSGKGGIDQSVLKDLPPELLAEIESTMPLCERVKMNKRKRSTVNERPKYAEVSSEDDSESDEAFESPRKKHKKDKDKAWEYEGHRDRRSSGDHRRSSFLQEGRRSSGSRYRERSPDDSEDDSPPPSLSDIARRMKKKEKLKKRKAYEPKLTPEEMMDSSTFKRFSASVDNILENLEDMDFTALADDDEIPQELLLGKHQLNELGSESAKIKAMGITSRLPSDKMVKLLNILEKNIQDGAKLSTMINHDNDTEDEERLWRDLIMERVTKSADACLTALNIMTSPQMPKAVYIEDVIERVLQYTKFHLQNTLYPQYDPVYRIDPHGGGVLTSKAKRAKCSTHKQRVIVMLYNKVCDIVSNMSELLEIQLLTDTTILQVSSMGITPFFVENVSELQLCAIKLVTAVFSRYEKHRQLILEEIFTSLARLPTSKRSLRNFRLNSSDVDGEPMYIQMVTALVLQLIQCVVHFPAQKDANSEEEYDKKVHQFSNKQTEMALRVASLDYLGTVAARLRKDAVSSKMDQSSIDRILKQFAKKFYIAQWFRDTTTETEKAMRSQNQKDEDSSEGAHHAKEVQTTGEIMQKAEARKKFLRSIIKATPSQFSTLKMNSDTVDYEDSCLIVRYLASMRPFAQSFDIYLTQILRVLGENAIAVRTKAMKCLSEVVAVDPSILARLDMQRGVHGRLMDNSTSVREAAVELLGRFVLSRPQLTEQYYDMLIERILDTGISVRKRVIKILRDICLEQPTFSKVTEMCVKMIRRVNDEEGIKLLKSEEDSSYKPAKKACVQLVDNLVEHILKYEESLADSENKAVNSNRLVACITTLYLFSKIRAQLMVKHAMTMQPYLTTKCNTQSDFLVICNVAKILELVVPLMEHPSETFLVTIEEDLMKLIFKYGMTVVQHCVSCLGAIVNKVTHNYKFVWACFNRYYGAIIKFKIQHQEDPNSTVLTANKPTLLRSLFTVGALCRHFDFDQEEFKGNQKVVIKDKVLELLLYFTKHADEEVQTKAIIGLGFSFIQHPNLMFEQEVKNLYNGILSDKNSSLNLKIQILKNLQTYLQEEDTRMQEADREWKKLSKQEDLKEMGDISSGMSSSIMQLYLKQVLEAFFHTQSKVRHFALNVIALTLNQGLIHPVQCVPYLIAMGTDPEPTMRNKADQQLVEIDKKYTGFIHMKAVAGIKMSYQVQQAIWASHDTIIRGFRQDENSTALCSHLYTMVRGNRQHRRAFLIALLNLFDDSASLLKEERVKEKTKKYFSEDDEDEQTSESEEEDEEEVEVRRPKKSRRRVNSDSESESESDFDDVEQVMNRLPDSPIPLIEFANASQGILLLLVLKQHLKNLYGFSDSKIQKYSPTESAKIYDKAVNRKSSVHFSPRQTIEFLSNDMANAELTDEVKRKIVRQYLDFKLLMEHLDPDEEDEEGEASASANARNKAINALLGGGSPKNNTADTEDDESDGEDKGGASGSKRPKRGESAEVTGQLNETVEAMDVIAICCPKYKDRPQIARVIQKTSNGYSVHWMAGSYSGAWAEAKKRDGRKLVPWVDTIKESDIIYKKIVLTIHFNYKEYEEPLCAAVTPSVGAVSLSPPHLLQSASFQFGVQQSEFSLTCQSATIAPSNLQGKTWGSMAELALQLPCELVWCCGVTRRMAALGSSSGILS
ncbi:NIPBL protein, partial [Polypterus senegalus]